MKAIRFEIIFSLEARTFGSENKRARVGNMTLLFLRASKRVFTKLRVRQFSGLF